MVETITPVVHGGRARWGVALTVHILGATMTAAAFGMALGLVGGALDAPWLQAGAVAVAIAASMYAINEAPGMRVPIPEMRRQVPDWWRTYFGWPTTSFLYGAGLGVGFFTYVAHGTLVVVAMGAVASGRPLVGAFVMAPFGLARGLSAGVSIRVRSSDDAARLVDRLAARPEAARAIGNGAVLVVVALFAARDASLLRGGWYELAAAILAIVFAWAATAKVIGARSWRRALTGYRLPAGLERMSARGVPAVELLVPISIALGLSRIGGVTALVVVLVASVAAAETARRTGTAVTCGCFGGRSQISLRRLLARNAALSLLALSVVFGAPARQLVMWPGVPVRGEFVPMVLTIGGLAIAAATLWRSLAWLGRGRSA